LTCHGRKEIAAGPWREACIFEIYSQSGPDPANVGLTRFEELGSFFDRHGIVQAGLRQITGPDNRIELKERMRRFSKLGSPPMPITPARQIVITS
jgi:hypothetical protein